MTVLCTFTDTYRPLARVTLPDATRNRLLPEITHNRAQQITALVWYYKMEKIYTNDMVSWFVGVL